ncbi:MAG: M48 family metalloprotease [PVC group bacterium]|nr:M48 family metalloprotease [PVC group bacterium]
MEIKKIIQVTMLAMILSGCATTSARLPRGAKVVDYKTYPFTSKVMTAVNKVHAVTGITSTPVNVYFVKSTGKENYSAAHIGTYKDPSGARGRSFVITTASAENYTEEDLLALWAHELAHAELKHIDRKVKKSNATTAVFEIANLFVPYAGYGNLVANPVIVSSYGKKAELEANRQGVVYLARLGYSKETMLCLLRKCKSSPGLFSVHPDIEAEIKDVQDMLQPQVIGEKVKVKKQKQVSKEIASLEQFSLLKVDMSNEEVINIFGKPNVIAKASSREVWTYQNVGHITFKSGKVIRWLAAAD